MEHLEIINGQGDLSSAIKRIGVNGSNLFACGNDPLLQSGAIVSQGKLISSKILDISLKTGNLLSNNTKLNRIDVKYINSDTKRIDTMTFNILNDQALSELINILNNYNKLSTDVDKLMVNYDIVDKKLNNISKFLSEYEDNISNLSKLENSVLIMKNELKHLSDTVNGYYHHSH